MNDTPNDNTYDDEDSQSFMPEQREVMRNHLRKLRHHHSTDVPAEMAQKAEGAFNVGKSPLFVGAQGANSPVSLVVYPQDPFVGEPEIRELTQEDAQPGLHNKRIRIRDSNYATAQPDEDNNYLYWTDTPEFNQVNAFYYATLTLKMCEKFAHRSIPWAFRSPQLNVDPHVAYGMNAVYDEQNRKLGFYTFDYNGHKINTAQSADVVSHETAHAVLDGMRDLYNQSFGMGPLAFHESFGDMVAVLVALQDDSLVRRLLEWTDGNLRMANFVTEVAEHLVDLLQSVEELEGISERTIYLRNAFNKFRYVPFDALEYLPEDPSHQLGRESHNYSRLFTGAFYDLFVAIYEHFCNEAEMKPRIAIHKARDVLGHILLYAVEVGPVGELDFADMARAFLTADLLLNDGNYTDLITQAFDERGILRTAEAHAHLEQLAKLPDINLPDNVDSSLESGIFLMEVVAPALNLPDIEFTPMSAHRNEHGFAFLTYFTTRTVQLDSEGYGAFGEATIDIFGGLTLAFMPDGHLVSAEYRPVTDEDVRQILILTGELIDFGMVAEQWDGMTTPQQMTTLDTPAVQPQLLYLNTLPGLKSSVAPKLLRIPVILDSFPIYRQDFVEYLKAWRTE